MMLASSFMAIYSKSMFEGAFAEKFPVRRSRPKSKPSPSINNLRSQQLYHDLSLDQDVSVSASDVRRISMALKGTLSTFKSSYLKQLFSPCLCKFLTARRDRHIAVKRQAMEHYSAACDIRSLINVKLNQSILLDSLLTKAQKAMFMSHRRRALRLPKHSDSSTSSSGD